jgi:hypothetical protein
VTQGLERRKAREEAAARLKQQQQQQLGGSNHTTDGKINAAADAPTTATAAAAAAAAGAPPPAASPREPAPPQREWARAARRQALQLAAGLAALILAPAVLSPGGISSPRVWLLFAAYFAFFASGSVRRILRHGPLAPAREDAQRRGPARAASLLAFIAAMPVIHWLPLRRFLSIAAAAPLDRAAGLTLYDLLGAACIAAAIRLNWWAADALGSAYDRVVAPKQLVKDGPYKLVQVGRRRLVPRLRGRRAAGAVVPTAGARQGRICRRTDGCP